MARFFSSSFFLAGTSLLSLFPRPSQETLFSNQLVRIMSVDLGSTRHFALSQPGFEALHKLALGWPLKVNE